ncbi:MAG: hypothetical protein IPJ71_15645 [Bdellovibrionales bacterium]|nr:hypothetical protein [Bdellovibrionales bacterium]
MNKIEFAERVGIKILNREHDVVMAYTEEDSEYIPRLKRIVASISASLTDDDCAKAERAQFEKRLKVDLKIKLSRSQLLQVEGWLQEF